MPAIKVKPADLKLGDVLQCWDHNDQWNTGIVKQVTADDVTIFRPYGSTADFSCTSGVICYTGIEEYKIYRDSKKEYLVYSRQDLK